MIHSTHMIPSENLHGIESLIAKLNKRAVRIGAVPVSISLGQMEQRKRTTRDDLGFEQTLIYEVVPVTIQGMAPIIAGWQFVAVIEHTTEGNIVRRVPGSDDSIDLIAYRTVDPWCSHCNLIRKRNDTYLVQNIACGGAIKQVGSSCLKDFTGHADPHAYARLAEMLIDLEIAMASAEDDYCLGGGGTWGYRLDDYLVTVAATIRQCGWVSRKKAYEEGSLSTSDTAEIMFRTPPKSFIIEPEDASLAALALSWAQGEGPLPFDPEASDYNWSVSVVAKHTHVTSRQLGIAASIVYVYGLKVREALLAEQSSHVGTVGQRQVFTLRVAAIDWREDRYSYSGGSVPTYRFAAEDGSEVIWWASNDIGIEVGQTVNLKATVKKHHSFRGKKQTIIARAVFA